MILVLLLSWVLLDVEGPQMLYWQHDSQCVREGVGRYKTVMWGVQHLSGHRHTESHTVTSCNINTSWVDSELQLVVSQLWPPLCYRRTVRQYEISRRDARPLSPLPREGSPAGRGCQPPSRLWCRPLLTLRGLLQLRGPGLRLLRWCRE